MTIPIRSARHAIPLVALLAVVAGCAGRAPAVDPPSPRAQDLARETLIVDTHIDVPYRVNKNWVDVTEATADGDFDYPRARAGGLDVVFMSIYVPPSKETDGGAREHAEKLIGLVEDMATRAPDKFRMAPSVEAAVNAAADGRIALAMGIENGAPLEGDLDAVRYFRDRGVRYITLAHSKSNHLSDSSYDTERPWAGLSPFGKTAVREMNRLGVMIDVSHLSDKAFYDVLQTTSVPVIASHSSARHFTPGFERNMSDDMIVALAENGGVIQINFGSTFVSEVSRANWQTMKEARDAFLETNGYEPGGDEHEAFTKAYREKIPLEFADISDVLDHFDHVRDLVGIEHIGFGSDYDGVGDSLPTGLKSVADYPRLIDGLLERGYSEQDIRKIASGNILRVWRAVEAAAVE